MEKRHIAAARRRQLDCSQIPNAYRQLEPFSWRLRDAWAVLTGKADAFVWPGGQ